MNGRIYYNGRVVYLFEVHADTECKRVGLAQSYKSSHDVLFASFENLPLETLIHSGIKRLFALPQLVTVTHASWDEIDAGEAGENTVLMNLSFVFNKKGGKAMKKKVYDGDIRDAGTIWLINDDILSELIGNEPTAYWQQVIFEVKEALKDMGIDIDDGATYALHHEEYDALPHKEEFELAEEWDDEHYGYVLDSLLPAKYKRFLVVAKNATWNGATGVKLASDIRDAMYRSYDSSVHAKKYTHKGKVLECTEYSHDRPQGHPLYIIGLTDKQYDELYGTGFDTMFAFAQKYIA